MPVILPTTKKHIDVQLALLIDSCMNVAPVLSMSVLPAECPERQNVIEEKKTFFN
jgi:hypothetical protein